MASPSASQPPPSRPRWVRWVLIVLAVLASLALMAWWLTPKVIQSAVNSQLDSLEARTGLSAEAAEIIPRGRQGIGFADLAISYPDSDEPFLVIAHLEVDLDLWQALRAQQPTISALRIDGLEATVTRYADGDTSLQRLRGTPDAPLEDTVDDEAWVDALGDRSDGIDALVRPHLRHFGDALPHIEARELSVRFQSQIDDQPWPLEALEVAEGHLTPDGDSADFELPIDIRGADAASTGLPESIAIEGRARRPLDKTTVDVDFDPWLRPSELIDLPHLQVELGAFAISAPFTVEIHSPSLSSTLREDPQLLAEAESLRVEVSRWQANPANLSLLEVHLQSPRLPVSYLPSGASNLNEFIAVLRQPAARHVAHQAAGRADAIAALRAPDDDPHEPELPEDRPGLLERISWEQLLTEDLPRLTRVEDLRIDVEDLRDHSNLTAPVHQFAFHADLLELTHSPIQGLLEADISVETITDDAQSHADIEVAFPYRSGDWEASIDVSGLELSQFAQLLGPRVSRYLHGGRVSALLDMQTRSADGRTTASGLFSLDEARFDIDLVAPDPIEIGSTSLQFDGYYAPDKPIPEPTLLNPDRMDPTPPDEEDDPEAYATYKPPPQTGAIVLDEATARLGDLEASLEAALYGLDGRRRPNRFKLHIDLPTTPLQSIVDATPSALRGPLDGLRMAGDLTWRFDLEVPFHRASQMVWNANVHLSDDLEVLSIPTAVDVFKLMDSFEHTITDDWEANYHHRERDFHYERTISIPEASPTPAQWVLDNTELDLDQLDERRRERQWPELPYRSTDGPLDRHQLDSADIWLSDLFDDQYAPRPWDDDPEEPEAATTDSIFTQWTRQRLDDPQDDLRPDSDADSDEPLVYEAPEPPPFHQTDIEIDPDRHGPYVYVPLHHISPYVVRAIFTTEDNSFFSHKGFNYHAIRHSVQDNLEAGRYVRGASTISMQLAKNLFLDFDRHLSRKLQEITLVWLMESMADIPKTRMLELYLNIIEFGPGVFGINEASLYYFGKRPDMLSVAEAAWLVSIVPNPKRFHHHYERGEINVVWQRRMARYIRGMYHRERITKDEKEEALKKVPPFYFPDDGDPLLLHADQDLIVTPEAPVHQRDEDDEDDDPSAPDDSPQPPAPP